MTSETRTRVHIPVLVGLGILAALSVLEAFEPQTRWFTFPAMVVVIILLIAARLFYCTRAVADVVQSRLESIAAKDADPNGPIHPR